jgi:hypothetical protein
MRSSCVRSCAASRSARSERADDNPARRTATRELTILVGRWAPPPFEDESNAILQEAGVDHVATTLIKTREQRLALLAQVPGYAGAEQDDSAIRQVAGGKRV